MRVHLQTLRFLICGIMLPLLVAGCGDDTSDIFAPAATDTPIVAAAVALDPTPTSVDTMGNTPTDVPTIAPTTTPIPKPEIVLPAPLYFLSDGQIQRLETDGVTLTQLTQEAEPITDFDVSPIDARLVYVTGNSLIEANPQYGTRIVKVSGETVDADNPADNVTKRIDNPRFSPDGTQIAFALDGVNLIPAGEDVTSTLILASDPYPDLNNPPRSDVRFFSPDGWSPDGRLLLVEFSYWPEAGGLAILNPVSGELTELTSEDPNTPTCCDWAWSRNSDQAFVASNLLAYGTPGLAQVDVTTGAATLILAGLPAGEVSADSPLRLFLRPHETSDGDLFTFVSEQQTMQASVEYVMAQVENGALSPLRPDAFNTYGDLLWARDGSGAAVVDVTQPPGPLGFAGPIRWLATDGSPAVELPAFGEELRWGPSATTTPVSSNDAAASSSGETNADPGSATFTAQVLLNVRSGPSTAFPIVGDLVADEATHITGISPDGDWWQIVYPPDSETRAWVIGDPQFGDAQNADDVAVVTPPPLPRPVGRIFYSAPNAEGVQSILAQSLAPGASPVLILPEAAQPSVYRNGDRVALRSIRSDLLGIGIYDLTTIQLTGVTSHLEDSIPNWNPGGDRIVFASTRHGDRRWRIYTAPADGSETAQELTFGLDPDWHPSADLIVFKGCDERGESCGLWTMNSSGGEQRLLTENKTDSRPVWSADGRTIVFMSESRHGNWEVYSLSATNGAITRLTSDPALDGLPVVSPDGSRVAFVSNREGSWGIWVVSINGGVTQRVVNIGPDLPNWLEQGIDWAE